MATRKSKTWLWYGVYAAVGYYGYQWWQARQTQMKISTPQTPPAGTQ